MKSTRLIGTASISCGVALVLAGTSLASNVSLDTTGPQSVQDVKLHNSNEVDTSKLNFANVVNSNDQRASTGDVTAEDNNVVGGLSSGNAQNINSAKTSVSINNSPAIVGQGASSQPVAGSTAKGGAGNVLGASTTVGSGSAAATLPSVGASVPMDVSALRAAWHEPAVSTAALVKQTQGVTGAMLALAALLSLLGGVGSAVYGRRKEGRA
jgi:hypothetical protein